MILHGCRTGIEYKNVEYENIPAIAKIFSKEQGIIVIGQAGYAYFSKNKNCYTEIELNQNAPIYLWAYNRGYRNNPFSFLSEVTGTFGAALEPFIYKAGQCLGVIENYESFEEYI